MRLLPVYSVYAVVKVASNFKISTRQNKRAIFMALSGDFDDSSACELIRTLRSQAGKAAKIYIDTSSLSLIDPFGLRVFQKDCVIYNLKERLAFIGVKGNILSSGVSRAG